jgi:hypothetical protein
MNAAWQLPLWGATVPSRLATGCSRRCATATAPAQGQTDVPRQAELVICNQSIERTNSWMNGYGKLRRYTEKRRVVVDFHLFFAAALVVLSQLIHRARTRYRWPSRSPPAASSSAYCRSLLDLTTDPWLLLILANAALGKRIARPNSTLPVAHAGGNG